MTSNVNLSLVSANAQATAIAPLFNSGYIDIYSTSQPSTPEISPGGTSLVTFALPVTFAASVTNGVITANTITSATVANTGIAVWFRVWESDHATPIYDGLCGTSGSDMNLATTSLVSSALLSISSFTFTVPGA